MDRSLLDLTDKVAVITGGSRGIGKAIAFAYAEHGADVVIASRKLDNCQAVADEIAEKTGRKTLAVGTHVGRWDECNALADTVLETFGRCDILVNNAGMSPLYEKVTDITEEYYDKVQGVNLKGPFALSLRLGGHMFDHDGGVILNISTVGSIRTSKNEVVYGMAKSGSQRDDRRPRRRLRAEGAGQLHPAGRHPDRHLQGVERGDDRQRPQDPDGPRRLRRGLPRRRAVLRQRGVGVDHRHVPARRRRRGPPAGPLTVERVEYDEFGLFADNASEFGLPYDGPPTVRREFVAVDGDRRLSALVWGSAPPELVFLHGGRPERAHVGHRRAGARPAARVHRPARATATPTAARNGQLDLADNAADVAVAIRALAPDAKAVIGMSLGGMTTIALARHAPDLVRAMVLVDITPGVTAEKAKAITDFVNGPASFPSFEDLLPRTMEHNPTRSEASLRRGILHNAEQREDGSWVWRYARHRPARRRRRAAGAAGHRPQRPVGRHRRARPCRCCSCAGCARSPSSTTSDEAELQRRLPSAQVVHVAEAGHSVQGDTPVELARIIADFVP